MSAAGVLRRGLAKAVSGATGARVVTASGDTDLKLPDQAIYYANHSSHLDFLTIWAALPAELQERARPVAAKDYWGSGIRKTIADRVFNAYLVDRYGASSTRHRSSDSGVSPQGNLSGMTDVLDAGDSLIIFPEGTRGDGERIATFRSGLYRLARHHPEIPVVPVTLANLGRILPKGEFVPVPHLATVVFCDPIYTDTAENQDDFLSRARGVLVECLADHQTTAEPENTPQEPEA